MKRSQITFTDKAQSFLLDIKKERKSKGKFQNSYSNMNNSFTNTSFDLTNPRISESNFQRADLIPSKTLKQIGRLVINEHLKNQQRKEKPLKYKETKYFQNKILNIYKKNIKYQQQMKLLNSNMKMRPTKKNLSTTLSVMDQHFQRPFQRNIPHSFKAKRSCQHLSTILNPNITTSFANSYNGDLFHSEIYTNLNHTQQKVERLLDRFVKTKKEHQQIKERLDKTLVQKRTNNILTYSKLAFDKLDKQTEQQAQTSMQAKQEYQLEVNKQRARKRHYQRIKRMQNELYVEPYWGKHKATLQKQELWQYKRHNAEMRLAYKRQQELKTPRLVKKIRQKIRKMRDNKRKIIYKEERLHQIKKHYERVFWQQMGRKKEPIQSEGKKVQFLENTDQKEEIKDEMKGEVQRKKVEKIPLNFLKTLENEDDLEVIFEVKQQSQPREIHAPQKIVNERRNQRRAQRKFQIKHQGYNVDLPQKVDLQNIHSRLVGVGKK